MREIKTLSKETLIYGASAVVGRFLNFLLVPFYVNILRSTAEYGVSTSLYTYIGFFNVIYTLGLEGAFFRYGARAEGEAYDAEREKKVFSGPFLVLLAAGTILSFLLLAAAPVLVKPVFYDPKTDIAPFIPALTKILRLAAGILFFDNLTALPFAVLRLERQAVRFAAIRLIGIVATLVLNFILVLGMKKSVEGIFTANLAASVLVFLLLTPTIARRLVFRVEADVLKKFIPFGLTNIPASLGAMMAQVIDRPIVQSFLGLGALGVYQANYRLGSIMMIFVSLFEYAWRPFFMRQFLKDDARARILFARVFTYFMTAALVGFLVLSWILPAVVTLPLWRGHRLLKETYFDGLPIVPVVILAYVFQGMYTNFIAGIYIKERNRSLPWITGLGAAVNVAANVLLIPRLGIMGAAWATLFAYMAMSAAIYVEARKHYPVPYEWRKIIFLTLLIGGAYGTDFIFRRTGLLSSIGAVGVERILLLSTVGILIYVKGIISSEEKEFSS